MKRVLFVGTILNIVLIVVFLIFYFFTNYFRVNNHYFEVYFDSEYSKLNKLIKKDTGFIIDFYFNSSIINKFNIFSIDLNNEIIQIIDPILDKNFNDQVYKTLRKDKKYAAFVSKRIHHFKIIDNKFFLSIESQDRDVASENADLTINEINKVYGASIFENSYKMIKQKINDKILLINNKLEFLNNNISIIYELKEFDNNIYLIEKNLDEINSLYLEKLEYQQLLFKNSIKAYENYFNFFNNKNKFYIRNKYVFTDSFKEFPLTIIFIFISIQLITFCYAISLRYYLK